MIEATTKEVDVGLKRAVAQTKALGGLVGTVGVFQGSLRGQFGEGVEGGDPEAEIANYAAKLEYGVGCKEYAWMRKAIDRGQATYDAMLRGALARVQDGELEPRAAVFEVLTRAQKDMKIEITNQHLIDTGAMRNSIMVDVEKAR